MVLARLADLVILGLEEHLRVLDITLVKEKTLLVPEKEFVPEKLALLAKALDGGVPIKFEKENDRVLRKTDDLVRSLEVLKLLVLDRLSVSANLRVAENTGAVPGKSLVERK
jgi:hypothetical protein